MSDRVERMMESGVQAAASEATRFFPASETPLKSGVRQVLAHVYACLEVKGYRPVDQLVGYLVTGDPAYITNHGAARVWIKKLERDEILEEMLREYLARE